MLVREIQAMVPDSILAVLALMRGKSSGATEICEGVYEVHHFGSSDFLRGYEQYPEVTVGPYGVCDDLQQLLDACPELEAPGREFVVTLTPVTRAEQEPRGGWRWHKWGEYIGTQNPQHEYLYDEEGIDLVYCFHVYERLVEAGE